MKEGAMPDESTTADASATGEAATTTSSGTIELGDAGKKALDEERNARKTAEKAARDAQAELDKLRAASMSEQEKAVAAAKLEGRNEALQTANERLVRAEVKAAAAGKLADPDIALGLIGDLTAYVDANGDVDLKGISSAIDDLVKQYPYLSARPGNGSGEGGPRGQAGSAEQVTDPLERDLRKKLGIST